jgi:hypothetical protein
MQAQDIVNQALTLIGRLGQGRTAGLSESTVAFNVLNMLLDSWSTKRTRVFEIQTNTYPLVAGTESYVIGPGGTGLWLTTRPVAIESADIVATIGGSTKNSYFPLKIIGQKEFAMLQTLGDQADISKSLYCDNAFPSATVYLFPTPALALNIDLYTWQPLTQFPLLTTTVAFPPGYPRMIAYNLAVEIAPLFEREVPEAVATIAKASMEAIEAVNARLTPTDEIKAQTVAENQQGNKQ